MSRFKRKEAPKEKLKNKFIRDVKELSKQEAEKTIAEKYAQKRPQLYQFDDNPHYDISFPFPKYIVKEKIWAELPSSGKSIFPVIACYCDANNRAWPSDTTIGILCGRSASSVKKGTDLLHALIPDVFKMEKTKKGKKRYILNLDRKPDGYFLFFRFILESGSWRNLKPAAHALYIVMRCLAWFRIGTYYDFEGHDCYLDPEDGFADRKYDFLKHSDCSKKQLAEFAGINENSVNKALKQLEDNWLIKNVRNGWLIYLKTRDLTCHDRNYLNECVQKSFGYSTRTKKESKEKSSFN